MSNVYETVNELIQKGLETGLIEQDDVLYTRNRVLAHLQLEDYQQANGVGGETAGIPDLLEDLTDYAVKKGIVEDVLDAKEIFSAAVMDCFVARPSVINQTFFDLYKKDPRKATDYFYKLSQDSNYIQTNRIKKNISYKSATEYGELDITINLSKPEKDPRQIALERSMPKKENKYPECLLCAENEGYAGRIGHPARANHRVIRLDLGEEKWMLQYSPYVYYNEHCIVLSAEHRPMVIDRGGFERLLQFVDQFPHYFAGSNADLPIVGGSILSHDHYQGGNYEFAMAKAEKEYEFTMDKFPSIEAGIVKWPMSVIRLNGTDINTLAEAADHVLANWKNYSDESVDIRAFSGETPHNTITPIARMRDGKYELDLVLRNNRTSDEHPYGIFHPHEDVHHIKKENIGLIEVMGLAVLPARLKDELKEVEKSLLGEENNVEPHHKPWIEELEEKYKGRISEQNAQEIVRDEVGLKFSRVLEDAGVFKRNEEGKSAFKSFVNSL